MATVNAAGCKTCGTVKSCDTCRVPVFACARTALYCVQDSDPIGNLWFGLNSYNFCPLLTKDVPRHSLCHTCNGCGRKFIRGEEGCSYNDKGIICLSCSRSMLPPGMAGVAAGAGRGNAGPGVASMGCDWL